jgi:tripartite-type tricarboxylate transporter receptor subunit TctC
MIGRRGLMGAAMGAAAAPAMAQGNWPDRPVRIVVGFPAGGPTDFPARLLQEPLQRAWGQALIIENRAGASGILASEVVAKSAPDGYTLLMGASVHASNPAVYPRLPYDTLRDFTPIVAIYNSPTVLFVAPDSPWRTVQELVAEMRRNPGMVYATSGNGTSGHFAAAMFSLRHHVDLTHVAYRGASPAFQDVMTGRVPMTFSTLSGALPLARDGKLRALAICGAQRVEVLPGVPTLSEAGLGIPDTSPWYGFIGPAAMPPALVERIASDVRAVLRRPEIARRIIDQGGIIMAEGPAAFAERIRHEMAETAAVARDANIRSE